MTRHNRKRPKFRTPKVVIEEESWVTKYWRPMMAWQYFVVCICDFIIFPSMAMYYSHRAGHIENFKWEPLTLTAGGFYHIAMGIVIGIAAYTRGQENILRTRLFGHVADTMNNNRSSSEECDDDQIDDEDLGTDPPAHPNNVTVNVSKE